MRFYDDKAKFLQHFKKGDYVKSTWYDGVAYFIVGEVVHSEISHFLSSRSSVGIDADGKVLYNHTFGIEDNDVVSMTPEEIRWFKQAINKQKVVDENYKKCPYIVYGFDVENAPTKTERMNPSAVTQFALEHGYAETRTVTEWFELLNCDYIDTENMFWCLGYESPIL